MIAILISPVLTRLYTPADFGVLAAYASLLGIIAVAASFRYELAIPLPEDERRALDVLALAITLVVASSLLWTIIVVGIGADVSRALHVPSLEPYLPFVPLGVLCVGAYQALSYWAIRRSAFGLVARTKVVQGLGSAAVQVGAGLAALGPGGLVVGSIVGQAAGGRLLARPLWAERRTVARGLSPARIRAAAVRYRRFPLFATGSSLLSSVSMFAPTLLLASLYGTHVAGWFALADRVSRLPLNLVGSAVGQVYLSRAATLAREAPRALLSLYLDATRHLLVAGTVLVLATAVLAPLLFATVFGPDWKTAGIYVALLGAMLVGQFVFNPLSQTLYVLEEQALVMLLDTGRAALAIVALALPHYYGAPAGWAILCFSLTMAAVYGLYWLVTLQRLRSLATAREAR